MDKYNLIFVYPIDFDSKMVQRKVTVVYSIVGVILFQTLITVFASTIMGSKVTILLFASVVIQSLIIYTTLELIRKPWEG